MGKPARKKVFASVTERKPVQPILLDDDALITRRQAAFLLGTTTRTLDKMIGSGQYPRPDTRIPDPVKGEPRWRLGTHRTWVRRRCGIEEIETTDKNRGE